MIGNNCKCNWGLISFRMKMGIGLAGLILFLFPTIYISEKPEIFYAIFGLIGVGCLVITKKSPRT